MKKALLLLLIIASSHCLAQDSLQMLNFKRNQIKNGGMQVLGSWAAANLVVGGIGWASTSGQTKYFHQMNTLWNVANLGVALLGYSNTVRDKNRIYSAQQSIDEQRKLENIFLINGGLDLGYIGAGIYLRHRGIVNNSDQSKGYGSAVIMQGAFLLLFDATMYTTEHHAGNKLRRFLIKNQMMFDGHQLGAIVSF